MSLATDYAQVVKEARRLQLGNDAAAVRAIERLLTQTAKELRAAVQETPRGIFGQRYERELLANIEAALDRLRNEYKAILDSGMIEASRIVEERERKIVEAVLAHQGANTTNAKGQTLLDFDTIQRERAFGQNRSVVTFGQGNLRALERYTLRTHRDGLNLSDRLYTLDQDTRANAQAIVGDAIVKGQSARNLAIRLEALLTTDTQRQQDAAKRAERDAARLKAKEAGKEKLPPVGIDNLAFRTKRLARTEINTAFKEAHINKTTDAEGNLLPHIRAIGFRLSPSHPRTDICDAFAGDDNGLGPGNYLPGDVPVSHPLCLCYTVSLLKALPNEEFVARQPKPAEVSESERKYYNVPKIV